jgi:hypothetical protein
MSNPTLSLKEVSDLAKRLDSDLSSLDLEAAVDLAVMVSHEVCTEGEQFYRACVEAVVLNRQPIWARIMMLGRKKFTSKLSRDEEQCFREARLLDDPPTEEIVRWWDRVTGQVRLASDQLKIERSRKAETLSIQYEIARLKSLGINLLPKWIAIEDNTAGYDVLSYEIGPLQPINLLIEVKSTIASPVRFIVTRNEWDQALKFGEAYRFHIWNLQANPPVLFKRSVADVLPHVPTDNKKGAWKTMEVPVGI